MDNETVVIDVQAKFTDNMTSGMDRAKKKADEFEKAIDDTSKKVEKVTKKKHSLRLDIKDNATKGIQKVLKSAKNFAKHPIKGTIKFIDKATSTVTKVASKVKGFVGKTWKATLSVVDKFTSPLSKLKNMLFSINSLITAVAAGLATKLVVANPVSLADTITSSTISFQTMLGSEAKGNKMMSDIMGFAKKTPFDTQGVIDGVQQMMAFGIEADKTLGYMEKIGNVASAMGKGEETIDSVTRALGQMKATGRVNAQDMLQLTSAGIKGWDYIAKGMGKSVAQVRKMSEDGQLEANEAIEHIMNGLSEFDGMMDKMSTRTVKGLWSNIKDTFDQSIVLKWGSGLQQGAIKGLTKFRDFLDTIDDKLQGAGTSLEKFGEAASTAVFNVLGGMLDRAETSMNSKEFQEADMGGKIKILWDDVIWKPFSEWWESTGKPKFAKKMEELGETLGKGISNGLLVLLGVDVEGAAGEGASIGASFAEGFKTGFDGEAVGQALFEAIKSAFKSSSKLLPGGEEATAGSYISAGLLAYGGYKVGKPLVGMGKGIHKAGKWAAGTKAGAGIKSAGETAYIKGLYAKDAIVAGAKKLGIKGAAKLALFGSKLAPGATSIGGATAIGASSVAGIVGSVLGLGSAGIDLFKGIKSDDKGEKRKKFFSAGTKTGMVGTGAAVGAGIGSLFGGVGAAPGALIGAGIGGVAALFGGTPLGEKLSEWTDEGGVLNTFFTETIPEAWDTLKTKVSEFFTETIPEKWDEFWTGVGDFFTETIPYGIGYAVAKIETFFTETLPEKWDEFWTGVGEFFTETIPAAWETVSSKVSEFFTETLPTKWEEFWTGVGEFFTETLPAAWEIVWGKITTFFTETIPEKWDEFWEGVGEFFTETIPTAVETIGASIETFFTETIPGYIDSLWSGVKTWVSDKWSTLTSSFKSGYEAGKGGDGKKADKNAAGGYIGSKTLSWLAEEGTPEMVIPLGAHRRGRGISLWKRTGELLGITPQKNALGGIVGGSGTSSSTSTPSVSVSSAGSISVSIGNITFEIKTSGDSTNILQAIREQSEEIADVVAGAIAEGLRKQYQNTPLSAR